MRFLGLCALVVALLLSAATDGAAQTPLAGNWVLSISSPEGDFDLPVAIAQDGDALTLAGRGDFAALVMTGVLEGSEVRWSWDLDFQGTPLDVLLAGTVAEGAMSGYADFGGMAEGSWSASRVEE
jgi:hypothetical protein